MWFLGGGRLHVHPRPRRFCHQHDQYLWIHKVRTQLDNSITLLYYIETTVSVRTYVDMCIPDFNEFWESVMLFTIHISLRVFPERRRRRRRRLFCGYFLYLNENQLPC